MRYTVYKELARENDIIIYDPLSVNWADFKWTNGYYEHEVTSNDILKPYLISYGFFESVIYEDIILLLNNVSNPFDMKTGLKLKIPKLDDLRQFLLEQKQKQDA